MSEVDIIFEKFYKFTDGYRMLLLLNRTEQDGHDYDGFNDKNIIRRITTNSEEFKIALGELLDIQKTRKDSRIYSCVNPRNIDKVIFEFKYLMLKTDYFPQEQINDFYFNIQNKFFSTLMSSMCVDEMNYLIDIDTENEEKIKKCEDTLLNITTILLKYKTKSGWHFITKPFNPELRNGYKIKYDAFILLNY